MSNKTTPCVSSCPEKSHIVGSEAHRACTTSTQPKMPSPAAVASVKQPSGLVRPVPTVLDVRQIASCKDPKKLEESWNHAARTGDVEMATHVAYNHATPKQILTDAATHENEQVRAAVASNPNLGGQVRWGMYLMDPSDMVRRQTVSSHDPEDLRDYLADPDGDLDRYPATRAQSIAYGSDGAPDGWMEQYANDPDPAVRGIYETWDSYR